MNSPVSVLAGNGKFLSVLGLVTLLLVAGCIGIPFSGPSEQKQPVQLVLNNSVNVSTTFEVYVFKRPATMTAHYQDGTVVTAEIGQGLSNHETGPRTVTNIEFPESAQKRGQYTLEPGEEKQSSIEHFPRNGVLFTVVSKNEGEIFAWVSANCDEQSLVGLEVTSEDDPPVVPGVSAGYGCR